MNSFHDLDVEYSEVRSVKALIKMLHSGRVDAILDYKLSLKPAFKEMGINDIYIKESVFKKPLYFIFYDAERDGEFKTLFDQGMKYLIDYDELKSIMLPWVGSDIYYPDYGSFNAESLDVER